MITSSKAGVFKRKVFTIVKEPFNTKEALTVPEWRSAMVEEYEALKHNHTWTLVKPPPHWLPIGCKWVFKVKENADGYVNRYETRLVAKGFYQTHVFDFTETFLPVVKPITI